MTNLPGHVTFIDPPGDKELRLFVATEHFDLKGRGRLWHGPCPFKWDKAEGLDPWKGEWIISHPEADHTKTYDVVGVESYCLSIIREGSPVGILVRERETI